ncbi:hypothetical protein [Amycolatopsis ultiminotia]|uniref:MmyB family transcriptional regulator n=1 Tax=Amycolatopsis ultiminotia TaxID=543629 RepID=UPI0031E9DED7
MGNARYAPYRWFTDPTDRERYHPEDHGENSRINVALLRGAVTRDGPGSLAADLAGTLVRTSDEFAQLWERHEVGLRWIDTKRFVHHQLGRLDLYCQLLLEPDQGQSLLIFTASPGTESHEKLALLTSRSPPTSTSRHPIWLDTLASSDSRPAAASPRTNTSSPTRVGPTHSPPPCGPYSPPAEPNNASNGSSQFPDIPTSVTPPNTSASEKPPSHAKSTTSNTQSAPPY